METISTRSILNEEQRLIKSFNNPPSKLNTVNIMLRRQVWFQSGSEMMNKAKIF